MKFRKIAGFTGLFFYILILYQVWHLCQYGGVRNHLVRVLICVLLFLGSFAWWLVLGKAKRKEHDEGQPGKKFFYIGFVIALVSTIFFGGRMIYSAIPYHGALSWKVEEWMNQKSVQLKHNNFFDTGVEGVLADLDEALDLPEELYIANQYQMTFNRDGVIQTIYTFLYGKDEDGETSTYLVDYDEAKSADMIVRINGQAAADYDADRRLQPMLEILEEADCESWAETISAFHKTSAYEILYMGRRSFDTMDGLNYIPGDADGDGIETGVGSVMQLQSGGEIVGFEVSLHVPDMSEITPVRYIMEPEYISPQQLSEERQEQQASEAKVTEGWTVDSADGTMYFFLDESSGWRLVVTDAAAGSRFYEMEKTVDGGATWESVNKDPFGGSAGVTEGLVFFDQKLGFAGLTGASQTTSQLYITRDGGKNFEQMQLPMETATELPDSAQEYGYTLEDYDYFHMPEKEGNVLTVKAVIEAAESEGITFYSEDYGTTWTYAAE